MRKVALILGILWAATVFVGLGIVLLEQDRINNNQSLGTTKVFPSQGGTGSSATPTIGQVLAGVSGATYEPTTTLTNFTFTSITSTNLNIFSLGNILKLG